MKTGKAPPLAIFLLFLACINLQDDIAPTKALTSIGQVPWESLQAVDTVLVYWRSTPYKEKWVICRQDHWQPPSPFGASPGLQMSCRSLTATVPGLGLS